MLCDNKHYQGEKVQQRQMAQEYGGEERCVRT